VEVEAETKAEEDADHDLAGEVEGSASCEGDPGRVDVNLLPCISATQNRSQDREGGTEIEVEADGNGSFAARLGMQRSQTRVHQGRCILSSSNLMVLL
jgi:hypothetical protein